MLPQTCTPITAARLIGRSPTVVRALVDAGVLPATRSPGGHVRINLGAVELYRQATVSADELLRAMHRKGA